MARAALATEAPEHKLDHASENTALLILATFAWSRMGPRVRDPLPSSPFPGEGRCGSVGVHPSLVVSLGRCRLLPSPGKGEDGRGSWRQPARGGEKEFRTLPTGPPRKGLRPESLSPDVDPRMQPEGQSRTSTGIYRSRPAVIMRRSMAHPPFLCYAQRLPCRGPRQNKPLRIGNFAFILSQRGRCSGGRGLSVAYPDWKLGHGLGVRLTPGRQAPE
jgi:hypothetical protein